jgi:plastocyanin/uncharacterized membrane protein
MMRILLLVLFVTALLMVTPAATPAATAGAGGAGGVLLAHAGGEMEAPESGTPHFVRWVGHFHPPITAFPIAMLVGAAIAELLRIVSKANWLEGAARWCVILGAISAVIAAPLGWAFAAGRGQSWVLQTHRWLGTSLAVLSIIVLVLSERRYRAGAVSPGNPPASPAAFRTALFLSAALVVATGFFGGAMVYGLHAYYWNPPEHEHTDTDEAAAPAASQPSENAVVTIALTDDDTFQPATATVPAGTTVRWVNKSSDKHTVSNDPKSASDPKNVSTPANVATFNSGPIRPGGSFEHKFTTAGTYHYICEPHEEMGMKGTITVTKKR